jgi:hypothetical protein
MSEATKQATTNPAVAELKYIKCGVHALVGTGNVAIGSCIICFSDLQEVGPDPLRIAAGCFVLCGLLQKLFALLGWVELYRNR